MNLDSLSELSSRRELNARATSDSERKAAIRTNRDAFSYVQIKLADQVRKGVASNVSRDKKIEGDAKTRIDFLSLLPLSEQRRLFLYTMSSIPKAGERVRALFGAPPYPWLLEEDAYTLSASGIAPSRSNMSAEVLLGTQHGTVYNYYSFGVEHFVDMSGRQYRVTPLEFSESGAQLVIAKAFEMGRINLTCRIPKKVKRKNSNNPIFKTQKLAFPKTGDALELQKSPILRDINLFQAQIRLRFVVTRVQPRSLTSSTALVEVRRV